VIVPSLWQEYFVELKEGIDTQLDVMREYKVVGIDYRIPPVPSPDEAEKIKAWISENQIDAVLYCASHYTIDRIAVKALQDAPCPIFWVGDSTDTALSISHITIDAELTGKLAADFLTCAAKPKVKAAIFTGSLQIDIHRAKTNAFRSRLQANGGTLLAVCETEDNPEKASAAVRALFAEHPDLNAIYVSTSTSAPVCRYLETHGLHNKVTLLGTDLFDALKNDIRHGIMQATIYQNQKQAGSLAASCAYEYISKTNSYGNADWKPQRTILVKPSLLLKANIE